MSVATIGQIMRGVNYRIGMGAIQRMDEPVSNLHSIAWVAHQAHTEWGVEDVMAFSKATGTTVYIAKTSPTVLDPPMLWLHKSNMFEFLSWVAREHAQQQ